MAEISSGAPDADERRVEQRAGSVAEEKQTDPEADQHKQAEQILKESDERTEDPATRNLDDDSVERRKSDDLVTEEDAEA